MVVEALEAPVEDLLLGDLALVLRVIALRLRVGLKTIVVTTSSLKLTTTSPSTMARPVSANADAAA